MGNLHRDPCGEPRVKIRTRRAYLRLWYGASAAGHLVVAAALVAWFALPFGVCLALVLGALTAWRMHVIVADPPRSRVWVLLLDIPLFCHLTAGLLGLVLWPAVFGAWWLLGAPSAGAGHAMSASAAGAYCAGLLVSVWAVTLGRTRVRHRTIETRLLGLPPAFEGYRIAHLSDLHVGSYDSAGRARSWVAAAMRLSPDVVVVTGDLVTAGTRDYGAVAAVLGEASPPDGVLVVSGNHDQWNVKALGEDLSRAGVLLLDGSSTTLVREGGELVVAGIRGVYEVGSAVDRLIASLPRPPLLLLAHYPEAFERAAAHGVALTLSGHTHAGQFAVPGLERWLNIATLTGYHTRGLYRRGRSWLYVSAGLGTTGLPMRVGARAEIALVVLRCSDGSAGQ